MSISALLLDIEGTTTSISFVHEILFPYSKARLPSFLEDHSGDLEVKKVIDEVRVIAEEPELSVSGVSELLLQWIAEDKKLTPLKALQGQIWRFGYEAGELKGHLYEDAYQYLQCWREAGYLLFIYSSGSVEAQKLLFGYSEFGNLTPLLSGYFDTKIGQKRAPESYFRISREIGLLAPQIAFLSDIEEELDAARGSGFETVLLDREDRVLGSDHKKARDFSEVHGILNLCNTLSD